jgi:hypothetical protein
MNMQPYLTQNPVILSRDITSIEVSFETGDGQQPRIIQLKPSNASPEVKILAQDTDWTHRAVPYSPLND